MTAAPNLTAIIEGLEKERVEARSEIARLEGCLADARTEIDRLNLDLGMCHKQAARFNALKEEAMAEMRTLSDESRGLRAKIDMDLEDMASMAATNERQGAEIVMLRGLEGKLQAVKDRVLENAVKYEARIAALGAKP